jgi:hypothetical protein
MRGLSRDLVWISSIIIIIPQFGLDCTKPLKRLVGRMGRHPLTPDAAELFGQTAHGRVDSLGGDDQHGLVTAGRSDVTAGTIGQWHSLPFPVRLAGIFLAGMAMIWLVRWLGGISVLVALLLWVIAAVGLMHASGQIAFIDRFPLIARVLDVFVPRLGTTAPTASAPSMSWPGETRETAPAPPVAVDLSDFVGLDHVFAEIDDLVVSLADRIRPVAPATLVLLLGPRGTGKSSVALALAGRLHRAGPRPSDRIVTIGPGELSGRGSEDLAHG